MTRDGLAAIFSSLLGVILWIGSALLLWLVTPLTGAALVLAALGLTFCIGLAGWSAMALWERRRRR